METAEQQSRYAYWQSLIEEQENSGLNRKEFCQQRKIVISQFAYYFIKLKTKKYQNQNELNKPPVVPVYLKKESRPLLPQEIKIVFSNGLQVSLPYTDGPHLQKLIEVLKSC